MLNQQKKKETISYLRNLRSQLDSIIEIILSDDIEKAYFMMRASGALLNRIYDKDFIHLLRADVGKQLEELSNHPELKPEDFSQLEKFYNERTSLSFEEFASVYKLMNKIKGSFR